jgi:hypothetical protein
MHTTSIAIQPSQCIDNAWTRNLSQRSIPGKAKSSPFPPSPCSQCVETLQLSSTYFMQTINQKAAQEANMSTWRSQRSGNHTPASLFHSPHRLS